MLAARVVDLMPVSAEGHLKSDWVRELANQLIGRIKNRLLHFNVRLQVGVSMHVDSQKRMRELESSGPVRIYAARTLYGEIMLTLEGMPEESQLVYVGQPNARTEGETILF